MQRDPHTDGTGRYQIRSLYFDDAQNSCYYENEDGTDPREKFRVRFYNGNADRLLLELKRKESGMTQKRSCLIQRDQVERLIAGYRLRWQTDMDALLKKFFILQETRVFQPKVIVDYIRVPYICAEGNVRITLDLNISTITNTESFFDKRAQGRPIMPLGMNMLEVKYDSFLPDYIFRSIQMRDLAQTTFSKYYYCRKFGGIQ